MIQFSRLSRQPLYLSIFELIVMARCQRLDREPEDSYEGGPSMIRCSELLAISPIYHISEACCPHRYEIPVANSGRQRFLESWGFCGAKLDSAQAASLGNCSFAKANCFKSGCQMPSVALNEEEAIKRRPVARQPPSY